MIANSSRQPYAAHSSWFVAEGMMGEFGVFHWLIVFVLLVNLIPAAKILSRTGHNPGWCVFFFFPVINLFMFWFFAFKPWPIDKPRRNELQPGGVF
jgi:hypothetical protein